MAKKRTGRTSRSSARTKGPTEKKPKPVSNPLWRKENDVNRAINSLPRNWIAGADQNTVLSSGLTISQVKQLGDHLRGTTLGFNNTSRKMFNLIPFDSIRDELAVHCGIKQCVTCKFWKQDTDISEDWGLINCMCDQCNQASRP